MKLLTGNVNRTVVQLSQDLNTTPRTIYRYIDDIRESAKTAGVQGRVLVSFKVNPDGKVSDVKVLRGVCDALDQEAVRVVSMSPDWTPGKNKGKNVAVTYTFPVIFALR